MNLQTNPFDFSNRLFTLLIIALIGLITFWSFRAYEIYNSANGNYPREISVEGIGKALVTPDVAKITLGVNTKAKTSKATVDENSRKINAIMKALTELGITKDDIKTTGYYLNPNYGYTEAKGNYEDGFMLDQTLEVTVRDFSKTGDVIAKSTEAGANTMGGVNFTVENNETAKAEAREQAIANARKKAEQLSEQTGLELGKVVSFYEYENSAYDYGKGGMMPMEAATPEVPAPGIEAGKQEISLTVTLGYKVY